MTTRIQCKGDPMVEAAAHNAVVHSKLAAAAPALVRALLQCEWGGSIPGVDGCWITCAFCNGYEFERNTKQAHASWCETDAALTAAGLPDQASRDEARRLIAEGKQV